MLNHNIWQSQKQFVVTMFKVLSTNFMFADVQQYWEFILAVRFKKKKAFENVGIWLMLQRERKDQNTEHHKNRDKKWARTQTIFLECFRILMLVSLRFWIDLQLFCGFKNSSCVVLKCDFLEWKTHNFVKASMYNSEICGICLKKCTSLLLPILS